MLFPQSPPFLLAVAAATLSPPVPGCPVLCSKLERPPCPCKPVVRVYICEFCLPVPHDGSSGPPKRHPCKQEVLLDVRLSPCTRTGQVYQALQKFTTAGSSSCIGQREGHLASFERCRIDSRSMRQQNVASGADKSAVYVHPGFLMSTGAVGTSPAIGGTYSRLL